MERLEAGENILCAEGYLLALSRRGYITHGVWVPEFILEQPDVLKSVHYEMAHAGSDVMEAFQVSVLKPNWMHWFVYDVLYVCQDYTNPYTPLDWTLPIPTKP